MIVIGLTGSIGMGKSTAGQMLERIKIPVFDSDRSVHGLLSAGGAGVIPVATAFPEAYRKKTNDIDRVKLRGLLGEEHEKWDLLESLLHPLVQADQQDFLRAQNSKSVKIAALDIPLLFETGAEKRLDYTICLTAPAWLQRRRVLSRPGVSEEDFAFRLARQMPDAEKRRLADFVVQTGIGMAYTRRCLQKIINTISKEA